MRNRTRERGGGTGVSPPIHQLAEAKRNPLIRGGKETNKSRCTSLFCPEYIYFISRAKASVWGPSALPRLAKNVSTQQVKESKPEEDAAFRRLGNKPTDNRSRTRGTAEGKIKLSKVMPINTRGACDPNEPLPAEDRAIPDPLHYQSQSQ
jgi:hypothetical protein